MKHDYKAALEAIRIAKQDSITQGSSGFCDSEIADDVFSQFPAIEHALRIADKLMQEPSLEILTHIHDGKRETTVFNDIREQILKEIE